MLTEKQMLDKIKWDSRFKPLLSTIKIHYWDRFERSLIVIPYSDFDTLRKDDTHFNIIDSDGNVHTVPYHRILKITSGKNKLWCRDKQLVRLGYKA